ncbi:hypothetical protein ZIOFF_034642 [Zingiber officinale]|uniref:VAL1-3 N-terminal zinc finger domain-containing protein n=1 Tax=Zingiber officinale TaxID=94328 RepID=A0A8J5GL71_ZINOF|nr:hypothetical protein ZIOFF_034642 [Zingiber officinale]
MLPSSPAAAVAKICFNFQCKEPLPDLPPARRKGWRLRSGEIAELCDRCSCTFEQGNFCETYHSEDGGWRNCEGAARFEIKLNNILSDLAGFFFPHRVHCGCIVSVTAYVLLDAGGVDCVACATKPSAMAPSASSLERLMNFIEKDEEAIQLKHVMPINFRYALAIGTALAVGHYSRFEFLEKASLYRVIKLPITGCEVSHGRQEPLVDRACGVSGFGTVFSPKISIVNMEITLLYAFIDPFRLGSFCETYHSDDGGWRNCETCSKRLLALEVEVDLRNGRRWRGRQHGKRERSRASD